MQTIAFVLTSVLNSMRNVHPSLPQGICLLSVAAQTSSGQAGHLVPASDLSVNGALALCEGPCLVCNMHVLVYDA